MILPCAADRICCQPRGRLSLPRYLRSAPTRHPTCSCVQPATPGLPWILSLHDLDYTTSDSHRTASYEKRIHIFCRSPYRSAACNTSILSSGNIINDAGSIASDSECSSLTKAILVLCFYSCLKLLTPGLALDAGGTPPSPSLCSHLSHHRLLTLV
jgi:hypothetical protein